MVNFDIKDFINKFRKVRFTLRNFAKREEEQRLRTEMKGKPKTKNLVTESFSLKSYFEEKSLGMTREIF